MGEPETVIVHFYGHTDEPPVVCFDLRYHVKLSGTTTKLEQHVFPPGSKFVEDKTAPRLPTEP